MNHVITTHGTWQRIETGRVDLFLRSRSGAFTPVLLATFPAGTDAPPSMAYGDDILFAALPRSGAKLVDTELDGTAFAAWVSALASDYRGVHSPPAPGFTLAPASSLVANSDTVAATNDPALLIQLLETCPSGLVWRLDTEDLSPGPGDFIALPASGRLTLPAGARFAVRHASSLTGADLVAAQSSVSDQLVPIVSRQMLERARNRLAPEAEKEQIEAHALKAELMRFGRIFTGHTAYHSQFEDPLLKVLAILGPHAGYKIPAGADKIEDKSLKGLCRRYGIYARPVQLNTGFEADQLLPTLAFWRGSDNPVALWSDWRGRPVLFDPATGKQRRLTPTDAAALDRDAYTAVALLPDTQLTLKQYLFFGMAANRGDLLGLTLAGFVSALFGMAMPYGIGIAFSDIVPSAMHGKLFELSAALALVALVVFALDRSASLMSLRVEGRLSAQVTAALWQRLLRFPADFFSRFGPGDIMQRLSVAQRIHGKVQSLVTGAVVRVQHMLVSLIVMITYFPGIAGLMALLGILLFAATALTVYVQRKTIAQGEAFRGNAFNQTVELVSGITKIKAAGAESWAFNRWAHNFSELRSRSLRSRAITNYFSATIGAVQSVALLLVFLIIAAPDKSSQSSDAGSYLAFMTALGTYINAVIALAHMGIQISPLIGQSKRVAPFLETKPISEIGRVSPGKLRGEVTVDNVSFRYSEDGPLILDDISFSAAPGEFLAIVGGSGSGKSTLLRLMLGGMEPELGSILFDGKDRRALFSDELRSQVAAVMQFGQALPGSLLQNIRGNSDCTVDEAWQAAEDAGLADDIRAMPMGMETQITQGAASFSGGQLQRLMIARALAANPRILILDEATSALDEPTQRTVMVALESKSVTRIVVAHRLSTIQQADRILMIEKGKIIEAGSFNELMAAQGPFAALYAKN